MGRIVKQHPVGLYVIRGSAQNSGFLFGRVRQVAISLSGLQARYIADIIKLPKSCRRTSDFTVIKGELEQSFAQDISIIEVWRTRAGNMKCIIETSLSRGG